MPLSPKSGRAAHNDPVVIVGMACRVPGATSPSRLWENIIQKRDVQSKIPEDRFTVENFYHKNGANKGTTNAKYGYFLDQDIANFDAGFFGISGKEAMAIDPQQRLLLEVVYEALENAGITLDEINGSQSSVFCGCFTKDYDMMVAKDWDMYPQHTVTGTGGAILANRISYFYNLHGTSVTIDTACSSSLVCLHLGRLSILNGESDVSIIIGSSLHFDPREYILMTDLGMLSADGRSRAFDIDASGYVRGEGICAVILKSQTAAQRNGDNIRAVVRASGTNHDGKTQGITLPSPIAQEALIRSTYAEAGLEFSDTQYFEAHGTGTQAGDPREMQAIGAVFANGREHPLYVGSVKTNIGHLEGSSGLAGIIKTTLALEHNQIPPNMLFNKPNPQIDFRNGKLAVPTKEIDWMTTNGVRRASINSFGYGGTNAHVVLEGYQSQDCAIHLFGSDENGAARESGSERPYLLPITSHTSKTGERTEKAPYDYLISNEEANLPNITRSLCMKRTFHDQRSFVIASDVEEFIDQLTQKRPNAPWISVNQTTPRLGFVFTGQGAQWYAMGRQLIHYSPLFCQTIERCDQVLSQLSDAPSWSVMEELLKSKDASLLGNTEYSQPICTALQLGLVNLLASWRIKPTAVVGHSSGEMGAAYAAGILTFENALIAAYYRGLYMSVPIQNSVKGAMMAVGMSEAEARSELQQYEGKVGIAAINSPSTMTLSGDEDAIVTLRDSLTERKIFARQLQITQAFHSHHMFPLAPAYEAALNSLSCFKTREPTCRMVSSVTGELASPSSMGAKYWVENMTNMVRFSQALAGILQNDKGDELVDVLVEIGPHPALKGPSRQVQQSLDLKKPYFGCLAKGTPDYEAVLILAGQLFSLGYPVDLDAVNSDKDSDTGKSAMQTIGGKRLLDLPSYQWDHRRYWAETRFTKELRLRSSRHAILGAPIPGSFANRPRYRNRILLSEHPWLSDHVINGRVIFPGAGYISMAIEAVLLQSIPASNTIKAITLENIVIKAALMVPDTDTGVEIMLELRPESISAKSFSNRWFEFLVCSYDAEDRCIEHCHGRIAVEQGEDKIFSIADKFEPSAELLKRTDRSEHASSFYRRLNALGLQYGAKFSLLAGSVDRGDGFALANLDYDPSILPQESYESTVLHPTLLDASFHVGFSAIESCLGRQLREPYVPTFIEKLTVSGSFLAARISLAKQELQICVSTKLPSKRVAISDFLLRSREDELPLMEIKGLAVTSLGRGGADEEGRSLFFAQKWMPAFDMLQSDLDIPSLRSIGGLVELYTHQHPNAHILHLSPSSSRTLGLLSSFGLGAESRRRIASINVILSDEVKEADRERLLALSQPNNLLTIAEPAEKAYDLLILSAGYNISPENYQQYLREDGIVIFDGVIDHNPPGLKQQFRSERYSIFKRFDRLLTPMKDIGIILPSTSMSERAQSIFAAISCKYGGQVIPTTWDTFEKTIGMTDTFVILSSLMEPCADEKTFKGAQKLLTGIKHNIVWLTEGVTMDCTHPESAWVLGLLRSARSENDALRAILLDCDPMSQARETAARIGQALDISMNEDEFAERAGCVYIPRIIADDGRNEKLQNGASSRPRQSHVNDSESLKLEVGQSGVLDSLRFVHDVQLRPPLGPDEIEIRVKAASISTRDVEVCLGLVNLEALGNECAGTVTRIGSNVRPLSVKPGDRVVAWSPGMGCHRTVFRAPASSCVVLPDFVTFAEAASLAQGLVPAYFGLIDVARIQPEETVLIHCAASGQGQIALQLAKRAGASVLATVGSDAEIKLLSTLYSLEITDMFSSRDTTFATSAMARTAGRGVDVVLNTFTGPLFQASLRCLAPFGRFIDLSGSDVSEDTKLGLRFLHKSITFSSIDLVTISESQKTARLLQNTFQLVSEGHIKPPSDIFEVNYADVTKGFRLMKESDGIRSVVLAARTGEEVSVLPAKFQNRQLFHADKTYLLVGGLGGLGRSVAEWLYRFGARKIAFLSRSGTKRPEAQATITWLEARNVEASVFNGDVSSLVDVISCICKIGSGLAGIFHAAMVLQDTLLEKMTFEQWQTCFRPKAVGARNLHLATLHLELDFFVCFSSVAAVLGSNAQANYSAANSYLDAFMGYRRSLGLAGTAMNVGAVGGIGVIAENEALQKVMNRLGMDMIDEEELLYQLEEAVLSRETEREGYGVDQHSIITGISLTRSDVEWASKPLLRNLYANHNFTGSGTATIGDVQSLTTLLAAAKDSKSKTIVLVESLVDKMTVVLGATKADVDKKKSLGDYGLDSIVAVEFRKWFRNFVGVDIALFDILGSGSIETLCGKAVAMLEQVV